jgi:hypothetical protein
MAKVVYSAVVGDARNKAGGVVFTAGRFGSIVRRKVSPVQPRSSAQLNVRANFTALSKLWSDASMDTYRAAWIALAAGYPLKDVFGATHTLTGLQMFVRLNRALRTIGATLILPPPSTLVVPYPGNITLAKSGGPPITSLTVEPDVHCTAAEDAIVLATGGISPGRASGGARFRYIHHFAAASTYPVELIVDYVLKFGTPIIGRKVFVRVVYVNNTTGAQSLPSESVITI